MCCGACALHEHYNLLRTYIQSLPRAEHAAAAAACCCTVTSEDCSDMCFCLWELAAERTSLLSTTFPNYVSPVSLPPLLPPMPTDMFYACSVLLSAHGHDCRTLQHLPQQPLFSLVCWWAGVRRLPFMSPHPSTYWSQCLGQDTHLCGMFGSGWRIALWLGTLFCILYSSGSD